MEGKPAPQDSLYTIVDRAKVQNKPKKYDPTDSAVDEKMILEYMRNPTSNKMVKNQYDLYRNKNEYIDRLNKLIPMEILMPLGGARCV